MKDKVTPRERSEALASGKPVDRLPCTCNLSDYGCRLLKIPVSQYNHSAGIMAKAAIEVYRTFGFDSAGVSPGLLGIPEALGAVLAFSEKDRPQLVKSAIETYDETGKLYGFNPEKDGRLPLILEALENIDRTIGDEVKVSTGTGGPFTTAALIRGTDNFMRDLILHPEEVHNLLTLATELILRFMKAVYDRGLSYSVSEPVASEDLISPDTFRIFVKPYLTRVCDYAKKIKGKGPSLHICGHSENIWHDMADAGASFISLDNVVDLEDAKKTVGERVGLNGNVPPVYVLAKGTVEDVRNATRTCIKKAYDSPCGYVVNSGCTVPLYAPQENIHTMMDAVHEFGAFPVDPDRFK